MVDAARLQENWCAVASYGDQVPLFFYSSLFLGHPTTRDFFPVSMSRQRDKLVRALGQVVSRIDDLDAVAPLLQQLGRDHRRFGVAAEHYPAVGCALLATLEHFSGPAWSAELARDWSAAFELVAGVMVAAADAAAADTPPWWDVTVTRIDRRTLDVAVLDVTPSSWLPYRPGQSVAVEAPVRPRLWRYYSPATLPAADGSFELHVRLVPGGPVSTAIVQATQVGDVLRVGAPVGDGLTLDPGPGCDLLLLAGGTGLAPMKALVQQLEADGGGHRRLHLFWGVRHHRELYDLSAMRSLTDGLEWARFVPCVSHEHSTADGLERGSVVDVALRHGPWPDHDVYVCGSPGMVAATVAVVREAGLPSHRLHVEGLAHEEEAVS